jgi:hypothetical protein
MVGALSLISPSPPVEAVSGRPGEEFQGQGSLEAAFLARQDVICLDSSDSSGEEEEDAKPPAIPAITPTIRDGKTSRRTAKTEGTTITLCLVGLSRYRYHDTTILKFPWQKHKADFTIWSFLKGVVWNSVSEALHLLPRSQINLWIPCMYLHPV